MKRFLIASCLLHVFLLGIFLSNRFILTETQSSQLWRRGITVIQLHSTFEMKASMDQALLHLQSPFRSETKVNFTSTQSVNTQHQSKAKGAKSTSPDATVSFSQSGSDQSQGLDSEGSDSPQLLSLLRKKIDDQKTYPLQALENEIEGTPVIQFSIENGLSQNVILIESSGNSLLDNAALKAVKSVKSFPVQSGEFIIPIQFRLSQT